MERTKEEVKSWVMPILMEYIQEHRKDEEYEDLVSIARSVRHTLRRDEMLIKREAKWFHKFLEEHIQERMSEEAHHHEGRLILWIDELSIYSDAWAYWCRPGSYTV